MRDPHADEGVNASIANVLAPLTVTSTAAGVVLWAVRAETRALVADALRHRVGRARPSPTPSTRVPVAPPPG
jgi:hypothetical protein